MNTPQLQDLQLKREAEGLVDQLYAYRENEVALGFAPKGQSTYYSPNMLKEEVEFVNAFMVQQKMSPVNTRIFKHIEPQPSNRTAYVVRVAAVNRRTTVSEWNGKTIVFEYGDFSNELRHVVEHLNLALPFAENEHERQMITDYIKYFEEGNVEDHKKSQKSWIRDNGPAVESNLGFVESYRDPSGVRAEWSGFVAAVDKVESRKLASLVQHSQEVIRSLPWGAPFEKDVFSPPDFTSLVLVAFCGSSVPMGINLPNYDDIRQDYGFKNVILSNSVSVQFNFSDRLSLLSEADWELLKSGFIEAISINVALHELFGHGSGKLLKEDSYGKKNFDWEKTISPLTGRKVESWYRAGETWESVFGSLAGAYEECRAESVALYLSLRDDVLDIMGVNEAQRRNTVYVLWLNMLRSGLAGLEYYSADTEEWGQAHARARFAIFQVFLRAPNSILHIDNDQSSNLRITIDRDRILTDGRKAIEAHLSRLGVYKATADFVNGAKYFKELTQVDSRFKAIRNIVLDLRKPRRQLVQPVTRLRSDGNDVELQEFEGSVTGAIEAFVARHKDIPL